MSRKIARITATTILLRFACQAALLAARPFQFTGAIDGFTGRNQRPAIAIYRVVTFVDYSPVTRIGETGRYRRLKAVIGECAYPKTTTCPEAP